MTNHQLFKLAAAIGSSAVQSRSTPEKPFTPKADPYGSNFMNKVTDAIYWAEGGPKAKKPYGILSVPTRDAAHARDVAFQSVSNNVQRWNNAGRPGCFVSFMGKRYCPPSADPVGHKNWTNNVGYFVRKPKPVPKH